MGTNPPKINITDLPPPPTAGFNYSATLNHTLGFLNDPYAHTNTAAGAVGDPSTTPFAWLTWNNRPFVSQLELPLVPWAKSSRLCFNYPALTPTTDPYSNLATPFPRYTSFLQSEQSATPGTATLLYRLLEFVGVPSRFAGTDIQIDPAIAAGVAGHLFHPPFNRIPTYREPGKINLNTIFNSNVLAALTNTVTWSNFVQSRRVYPPPTTDPANTNSLDLDPNAGPPNPAGLPDRVCPALPLVCRRVDGAAHYERGERGYPSADSRGRCYALAITADVAARDEHESAVQISHGQSLQ